MSGRIGNTSFGGEDRKSPLSVMAVTLFSLSFFLNIKQSGRDISYLIEPAQHSDPIGVSIPTTQP